MNTPIGIEVSIKTTNGKEHTGHLYAVDNEYNLVVLCRGNENARDFVFLNQCYIKEVMVLNEHGKRIDPEIPKLDIDDILKKADQTIRARSSIPQNMDVSTEAQQIFAEIFKTYKSEWKNNHIHIIDLDVYIAPPYLSRENVSGPHSAAERISNVLTLTRRKLNLSS